MMPVRFMRSTARIAAGNLLLVKCAYALSACGMPEREPARAIAQTEASPCHEREARAGGLCVLHCLGAQQSLDKPSLPVPGRFESPVLVVAHAISQAAASWPERLQAVCPAADPPRHILFRTLLI
jgi:hypothetical protein